MARVLAIILALAAAGGLYLYWPATPQTRAAIDTAEFGTRTGKSLVLVEPDLAAHDYRNADALRSALEDYLRLAEAHGYITDKTIVVFPEYVGAFLVAADAPPLAVRTRSMTEAGLAVVADDPFAFAGALARTTENDRFSAALFRARSAAMAANYVEVFSSLARDFGVVIVAGAIILEDPRIEERGLVTAHGPLRNVSAVFDVDGSLLVPLVEKRMLIPSEQAFARSGAAPLPVFETRAGRLGVLICADSWHGDLYAELAAGKPDIVAVPAFIQASQAWDAPWGGYVTGWPDDASQADAGAISEGAAWVRHSLPARLAASGAGEGGVAFLMGAPWDLGADGRSLGVLGDRVFIGEKRGGRVTALWR